jgi:hypothetical protein
MVKASKISLVRKSKREWRNLRFFCEGSWVGKNQGNEENKYLLCLIFLTCLFSLASCVRSVSRDKPLRRHGTNHKSTATISTDLCGKKHSVGTHPVAMFFEVIRGSRSDSCGVRIFGCQWA